MTTSAYLALVEPVLTIAELMASDLRETVKIGRTLVTYAPRADHALEDTIEALGEKRATNDDEPQEGAPPTETQPTAALSTHAALIEFMKILRNAPGAPRLASEMANDWLKNASRPGAEFRGRQIVNQMAIIWPRIFQLIGREAAALLKPSFKQTAARAQLKSMYNDAPKPSIQLPTRLAREKWDAEHARPPQPKNGMGA